MMLTKTCPFCGKTTRIEVDETAFANWQNGMLIQDALPMTTATEREVIKTGMCVACQNMIFGEPCEEEDFEEEEEESEDDSYFWGDDADMEMGFDPYEGCYSYDC